MKFSESWLRELIDVPVGTEVLAEQLTMAGLEVEGITSWHNKFSGVIVGKVIGTEIHPDINKLTICQVDIGDGKNRIVVCGADNVTQDKCYPYAKTGALLGADMKIKKRTIKGVLSEGMLCSEKELGLAESANGIFELGEDAIPGQDLQEYLALDDNSIELSLTPNRGDCLSLVGIAREVAVLNQLTFSAPEIATVSSEIKSSRKINILETEACPRYCGRILEELDATCATPIWIVERLRRSDIRSVNVVVDLTNYVMLELGQPMHAFDDTKLKGDITIRMANAGEKLSLLDTSCQDLSQDTLVIADDSGAIAMAGIMGGESTSVGTETRTLFLESAFFSPQALMGRARRYGLHTDASHRFERGVDPALAILALERLTHLLLDTCGGKAGPLLQANNKLNLPKSITINLRASRIKRLLGQEIDKARVSEILQQLGFQVEHNGEQWQVSVPSYRFDVEIEVDLIEEIARIYGYTRIPDGLPSLQMKMAKTGNNRMLEAAVTQSLVQRGYREVITYSFVDPKLQTLLLGEEKAVELINPLSAELSVMRQSLWPGLLSVLQYNLKRQQSRLRLFEKGHVYVGAGQGQEYPCLSGLIYGNIYSEQWDGSNKLSDFYDLKSDVESSLMGQLNSAELVYAKAQHKALHAHQSAEILYNNQRIGLIGVLDPRIQKALELQQPVLMFELYLSEISVNKSVKYRKYSKYPSIKRDISIIIDEKITASEVINLVKNVDSELLTNLELFDVYQGEGIDLGKKSLALGLTFQRSSSTLTDEEADIVVHNILHSLQNTFGAILRE